MCYAQLFPSSLCFTQATITYLQIRESLTPISEEQIISMLSFAHIVELLQVEDSTKRAFYEIECMRGSWSVRELKRQINSLSLVELKLQAFNHENIGQLNTCLSWYKKNMMTKGDNPPVGILLCTNKDHALVEYALAGMDSNLFVSKYQLELPKKEEMQKFIEEKLREGDYG